MLYYIIPDYLLLELKPKIKKSLPLLEDESKLEMTIDSINHMNTNFAFSQIHEVWVEVCSPKRHAGVLTPVPISVTLFGNGVSADVIRLR